jgi:hypothetical protein
MGENKYLKLSFFQDIIFFVIDYLFSFPEHAKKVVLYLLHSNEDHENPTIVYPPLKFIHVSPQFITDFDQNLPSEPCDNITKLMSLMKPRLIFHLMYLIQHPPRLSIDTYP